MVLLLLDWEGSGSVRVGVGVGLYFWGGWSGVPPQACGSANGISCVLCTLDIGDLCESCVGQQCETAFLKRRGTSLP